MVLQHRIHAAALLVGAGALILGFWRLTLNGLGNAYYTAADISGADSMRNLFFAAFDRTGIMAVDKPPLGLVPPAAAVRLFGVSTWTVLGPQVVMFAVGIFIFHTALRSWFNRRVAVVASIVLLATPIDVAVARSNNPDELLVLLTIIGLVLTVESLRRDTFRWVVAAAVALGLAFTTKQLQAVVAVPAVLIGLTFLSAGTWKRRLLRPAVFVVVSAVSCLAWIEAVDHINPARRPYVANSTNDTEFRLAFGFNGAHRVSQLHPLQATGTPQTSSLRAAGASIVAQIHRGRNLLGIHYVQQSSWLLGAALVGGALALSKRRQQHAQFRLTQYFLLWTGMHTAVLTFIPGKFSPYYLAPLVPGIAALIAIAVDTCLPAAVPARPSAAGWSDVAKLASVLFLATTTAWFATQGALRLMVMVAACTAVIASAYALLLTRPQQKGHGSAPPGVDRTPKRSLLRVVSVCCAVTALVVAPARWTLAAVTHPQDSVAPSATLQGVQRATSAQVTVRQNDRRILAYAQKHATPGTLVIATPRVMVAALEIERSSQPVAPLGGFFGTDHFPTLNTFRKWVRSGHLRWVAIPDLPPGRSLQSMPPSIVASPWGPYARANCRRVTPGAYRGIEPNVYWHTHNTRPLHSPLALFDCRPSSPQQ